MPPTLSPTARLRSRTSDISDLLRGRHDTKTSTDSQQRPPPIPTHLAEPVTPTNKPKGKFSFLGRKRKPSAVSPSSARAANDAVAANRAQEGESTSPSSPGFDHGSVDAPTGPGVSPSAQKGSSASLPPLNVSPPSLGVSQLEGSSSKTGPASSAQPRQRIPSGIPTATLRNLRPQKSTSFEGSRRSNDSQSGKQSSSSSRPIITISPPHNIAEGATERFHAPRSAPQPQGKGPARHSNQSGITSPNSTLNDRGVPDSPISDVPGSATSLHSNTHFPIPSVDGPLATTSYKEESLLRKDHFELGTSEPQSSQRRGTVSGTSQFAGGSVGRAASAQVQQQQQGRHMSVLHFRKLKQDASASSLPRATRRSGAASDSTTSGNESTASSIRTVSSISRSKSSACPGARRAPPPLARTWHTPPSTGPPTEPLPSPPANPALQPLILSTTPRTSTVPCSSSPVHKNLPAVPPKDAADREDRAPTPKGRESIPPSPVRSEHGSIITSSAASTAEPSPMSASAHKPSPTRTSTRTPLREDAVKTLLANENATVEELREALRTQSAKYTRLMSYLLTLTERHGMEKHEFLRRIEALEQDARRRERELKGLRWIVANSSQSQLQSVAQKSAEAKENLLFAGVMGPGPARADSGTLPKGELPRSRQRSCSESVLTSSSNRASPNVLAGPLDSVARLSIDSPAGSTEDGLFELQSSIADFLAPFRGSPSPMVEQQQQQQQQQQQSSQERAQMKPSSMSPSARLRRSNTLPDSPVQLPVVATKQKQARRTSSPVLPVSAKSSPRVTPTASRSGSLRKTGLGIAVDTPAAESAISTAPAMERRSDRDPHARSDSSTLSSIPSLSTLHTASSGLSSIPETPRTDAAFLPSAASISGSDDAAIRAKKSEDNPPLRTLHRLSTSSLSSSASSGSGSASYATSSRVSASPSIAQVLDRSSRQPEMDAILRKLRAFGHHGSP